MTLYRKKLIMDRLREKISDGWVLNSIENMLKAGVMEDGILHKTTKRHSARRSHIPFLLTLSATLLTRSLKRPGISLSAMQTTSSS